MEKYYSLNYSLTLIDREPSFKIKLHKNGSRNFHHFYEAFERDIKLDGYEDIYIWNDCYVVSENRSSLRSYAMKLISEQIERHKKIIEVYENIKI